MMFLHLGFLEFGSLEFISFILMASISEGLRFSSFILFIATLMTGNDPCSKPLTKLLNFSYFLFIASLLTVLCFVPLYFPLKTVANLPDPRKCGDGSVQESQPVSFSQSEIPAIL